MAEVLVNIVSLLAVILLMGTFFFKQKIQFIIYSVFMFLMGLTPILHYFGAAPFNPGDFVALKYVLALVIVMSGRELIRNGMAEDQKGLKQTTIAIGILIIILVFLPALGETGALTFKLPNYPWLIDSILYIAGSILLMIGMFITHEQ
jgi:hypothetical protein